MFGWDHFEEDRKGRVKKNERKWMGGVFGWERRGREKR